MILVDDQPYAQTCPIGKTVRELAREICADSPGQGGRMVVAVYCEGQAVADDKLEAVLDTPVDYFDELAIQTQPVAALVRATLEQAISMLEDSAGIRTAAADLLDRGDQAGAMEQLQKLLDTWRQVQQTVVFSAEAMNIDLDTLEAEGCRFADLLNLMKANLGDLREAMRNQDPVLMGDLLRYEMEDVFAKWGSLLSALRESTALSRDAQ